MLDEDHGLRLCLVVMLHGFESGYARNSAITEESRTPPTLSSPISVLPMRKTPHEEEGRARRRTWIGLGLLLSLLGVPQGLMAQTASPAFCQKLAEYRDNELFRRWDGARARAEAYAALNEDLNRSRDELLRDTRWARSDWSLGLGIIASTTRTMTNLVNNLLGFAPSAGAARVTPEAAIRALEVADLAGTAERGTFTDELTLYLAAEMNPVAKALKTTADLTSDVRRTVELQHGQQGLRRVVDEQLANIERAIATNAANVQRWQDREREFNTVKTAVDSFLLTRCQ